jgi:hypothetical protein
MEVIHIGPQGARTNPGSVETDRQAAYGHLKKILAETKGHIYKIGIATNPTGRSYGHGLVAVDEREDGDLIHVTYQRGLWDRMFVIFQSPLSLVIRDAEREFIRRTKQDFADFARHNLVTMNESKGGEGPLGAKGPYFLYLLRSAG